jgi:hypothetical protein
MVAGEPDMVLIWNGMAYGMEFKTMTGTLSEAQRRVIVAWVSAGCQVEVIRDFETFKLKIDAILRSSL